MSAEYNRVGIPPESEVSCGDACKIMALYVTVADHGLFENLHVDGLAHVNGLK